ncbi:MAG: hypothetical protein KDA71_08760, partial [Planctomycetales bacterium]|nr:hypothetical protein [Planctomycetales bacterium]
VPNMKQSFESFQRLSPEESPWLPWPSKPVEVEAGDDAMAVFCPICFGDGHYYAADDDRACVYCDRTGLVERLDDAMIGQARYAGRYWNLIRQLPNVVYREPKRFDDVLWFRFSGGDGLLMPINNEA